MKKLSILRIIVLATILAIVGVSFYINQLVQANLNKAINFGAQFNQAQWNQILAQNQFYIAVQRVLLIIDIILVAFTFLLTYVDRRERKRQEKLNP